MHDKKELLIRMTQILLSKLEVSYFCTVSLNHKNTVKIKKILMREPSISFKTPISRSVECQKGKYQAIVQKMLLLAFSLSSMFLSLILTYIGYNWLIKFSLLYLGLKQMNSDESESLCARAGIMHRFVTLDAALTKLYFVLELSLMSACRTYMSLY